MREPFRVMLAYWMIALIQCSSSMNPTMRAWKKRTSHFVGCTIMDFLPDASTSICSPLFAFTLYKNIYVSMQFIESEDLLHWKHFGINPIPTRCEMAEAGRLQKKNQAVKCELALHYFHTRDSFHQYCIVPVQFLDGDVDTRPIETSCIQLWKPMLNHPWIVQLNPTSATRKATPFQLQQAFTARGPRLWKTVRRRLKTLGVL